MAGQLMELPAVNAFGYSNPARGRLQFVLSACPIRLLRFSDDAFSCRRIPQPLCRRCHQAPCAKFTASAI